MWRGDSEFAHLTTWIHFSYKNSSLKILRQPIYKWKVLSLRQDTNAFFSAVTFSFGLIAMYMPWWLNSATNSKEHTDAQDAMKNKGLNQCEWSELCSLPIQRGLLFPRLWPWPPTEIQYTLQGMVYFAGMFNTNWSTKLIKIVFWSTIFQLFDPIWETTGNFFKAML